MSTRRSARIRSQGVQQAQPLTETLQVPTSEKRKAPAEPASKRKRAKPVPAKVKSFKAQSPSSAGYDLLSSLPAEIVDQVLDHVKDVRTMSHLGRTCKKLNAIATPLLHRRLAVSAMYYAHIPKLIQTINPYLTIAQRQQLKTEGNYKGQQQTFPAGADPLSRPVSVEHVRQVVVGMVDPGRKHERIAHRYLEEVFRNMRNLEVVDTQVLKGSIVESVASLEHLKALRLFFKDPDSEEYLRPLTRVRNLRHLYLSTIGGGLSLCDADETIQSLVLNSKSTLRSLAVKSNSFGAQFVPARDKLDSLRDAGHTLAALRSLELSGLIVSEDFLEALDKAINFLGLQKLVLDWFQEGKARLYQYLGDKATSTQSEEIKLGILCVGGMDNGPDSIEEHDAICRFLASFDTLTELEIERYHNRSNTASVDIGLPASLLLPILNHNNLTRLVLSYSGIGDRCEIAYISPPRVASILEKLPRLEEFQFTPEAGKEEETGGVLAHGHNLRTVICYSHMNWSGYRGVDDEFMKPMHGIIDGFLNEGGRSSDGGKEKFVWEEGFKLRRLGVFGRTWDVASKFGKPKKGMMKAEQRLSRDGTREVWCRDISASLQLDGAELYQPSCEWVDMVS